MTRSYKLLLALPLSALIFSSVACSKDEPLSSTETIQAIYRARWAGAMLDRALQASVPLMDLAANASLEDATSHLFDLYEGCAEIHLEDDYIHVAVNEDCASSAGTCVGSYELRKVVAGEADVQADGFLLTPEELLCGEQPLGGTVALQHLTQSDVQPYPWLLRIDGLEHSDAREVADAWVEFPAATEFHGDFYLRTSSISPTTGETLALAILSGGGSFSDVELGLDWEIDAQELGMRLGGATPRAGALQLRSMPGAKYVFQTSWVALSKTATRVTVKKEKQQWVGCISDGDAKECQKLGY